ncbi:MAG: YbaB/EbfC family nucleoid-associated protein [Bacilli bacterium]
MNMQNLMSQAMKLQKEVNGIKCELDKSIYTVEKQGVLLEMNGKMEVLKFLITDDSLLEDAEILQDVISLTIGEVLAKIANDKKEKLGKYSSGMEGLI